MGIAGFSHWLVHPDETATISIGKNGTFSPERDQEFFFPRLIITVMASGITVVAVGWQFFESCARSTQQ
jgi:hypothetical protein